MILIQTDVTRRPNQLNPTLRTWGVTKTWQLQIYQYPCKSEHHSWKTRARVEALFTTNRRYSVTKLTNLNTNPFVRFHVFGKLLTRVLIWDVSFVFSTKVIYCFSLTVASKHECPYSKREISLCRTLWVPYACLVYVDDRRFLSGAYFATTAVGARKWWLVCIDHI